jgi:TatD DNase family protein
MEQEVKRYFFDSHAHLDGERFKDDLEATLLRAAEAGITDIVCVGASDGFDSNTDALALVDREGARIASPALHATVGIHPHDARIADADCLAKVRALAGHEKVVGVGETGLDYHYDHSPRQVQREVFSAFVRMANDAKLPLVIHTREAEDDTMAILEAERAPTTGGVIHCFTSTERLARFAVEIGFYVSFSGVITFKSSDSLRAIAKGLPKDRVLIETDCPFLTPVPHRGKRNEPAFVAYTAAMIAELWGEPVDAVKQITGENAARLFGIIA